MLNGDKTLIIVFSAPHHSASCDVNHTSIDGHEIVPAKTVKNLGVIFDSHINLQDITFSSEEYSNINSFLPDKAAVQLTQASVSSRLDYCNSLLHGLPSCSIRRLQSIQNIAARILMRTHKYKRPMKLMRNRFFI